MMHDRIPSNAVPGWFLQTVQVMQGSDRGLNNIEIELQRAVGLDGLGPRRRKEIQYVRNAPGAAKIRLSMMDVTPKQVLREITGSIRLDLKSAPAQ
jgi:hypothetical protein